MATLTLPRLKTVKQVAAECDWLTEKSLRMMIFRAEENGLHRAVRRIGGRVLIDVDEFIHWLEIQH